MVKRGLVLGGGGVAGIAWELGVLLGIRDAAPDLRPAVVDAEMIVGTSAGSTVAAQLATGIDLEELFNRQLSDTSSEIEVDFDIESVTAMFADAANGATSDAEIRRRIGALALEAATVPESDRRAAIAGRLPQHEWSKRRVLIPAVDAETGDLVVFTNTAGVPLVDAVAASCAVPGVWPPVSIDGRRYMDGGVRSATNADLADDCDRVLVISPALAGAEPAAGQLKHELTALSPVSVYVVHGDDAALAAFGSNPLSPATRKPAALAGRELGRHIGAEVAAYWR